jgi:uncharacterized protein
MTKLSGESETSVWRGKIPLQSNYTAGRGGQIFFTALKQRGKLIGTRCPQCDQVYFPARSFCERCFSELSEHVEVQRAGRLVSYTLCYVDHDRARLQKPVVLALVQLEGATTVFLHRLLGVEDPVQIEIGSQLEIVVKPKSKRVGSVLDIEGFRIVKR